jgi:hypothetical protein
MCVLALLVTLRVGWASVSLFDDRLALDASVRSGGHIWRTEYAGLARNDIVFDRISTTAGLTGRLSTLVSLKLTADVSYLQPQDMYVDFRWGSGFGLRAGQFTLPLGMDAMTEPDNQVLVGNSLLISYTKPVGTRDIGFLGSWSRGRCSVSAAVVNGNGANTGDNNIQKDLCVRLLVSPLPSLDADLGLRAYYGWPDSLWRSVEIEARLRRGSLELRTELQNHRSQYARNNATYLQAAWSFGKLKPAGQLDIIIPQGKHPEWMMTGGLSLEPISDHLRIILDCTYRRSYSQGWSVFGFLFRLQATI